MQIKRIVTRSDWWATHKKTQPHYLWSGCCHWHVLPYLITVADDESDLDSNSSSDGESSNEELLKCNINFIFIEDTCKCWSLLFEEDRTCCVIPLRILIITSNDLDTEHRAKCKLVLLCKGKTPNDSPPYLDYDSHCQLWLLWWTLFLFSWNSNKTCPFWWRNPETEGDHNNIGMNDNSYQIKTDESNVRRQCRITCGADVIIRNVLPFLLLLERRHLT